MTKTLWNLLAVSPAILGATLAASAAAIASESVISLEENVAQSLETAGAAILESEELTFSTTAPEFSFSEASVNPESFSSLSQKVESLGAQTKALDKVEAPAVELPAAPNLLAQQTQPVQSNTTSLDQLMQYGNEGRSTRSAGQVTSISQLRDVQPTDWAFQALQSLVERYGCIAGYPDGTYRGNRAMTRFEFAAGLNACLDRINELIAAATANILTREDLLVLQRLQEEFAAELATLRGRVDALEARTAELEANQFSTTTKLTGEAIFAVTDAFGDYAGSGDDNTVLQGRVRLNFNTSFTGRDLLITRLQAGNATPFSFQPASGLQTFNVGNTDNNFQLDTLAYFFNLTNNIKVAVAANAGVFDDFTPTLNPYLEDFDGGSGSLSTLGQRSPLYRIGGGQGIGANINLGRIRFPVGLGPVNLTLGYLADQGNNPGQDTGLFNGDYAALAQLTFAPTNGVSVGFTYVHGYHNQGNDIFDNGGGTAVVGTPIVSLVSNVGPAVTNSYGAQASFQFSPRFAISGWFGYTHVRLLDLDTLGLTGGADGQVWNYAINLAFPDFGRRGNLLGIVAGVPPYVGGVNRLGRVNNELPLHIEGFYKFKVSDNISVTPGVIWLRNAAQGNFNEDDIFIGTLRTTFTF
ncbi:MAG: iron uptake porin [Desertifilum sp.]|nr:iron uptake porin [Desertifilum sp.]